MTSPSGPQVPRKKIAILGGGIAAMTTAFELTSQPGWQDLYEITVHQLGWRLGGKCASSRGLNGRIEEHGIHAFMGSYYNTMPMMAACYAELARPAGQPLATFEEAFLPESFVLMWEWRDLALRRWPMTFPTNSHSPTEGDRFRVIEKQLAAVLEVLSGIFGSHHVDGVVEQALVGRARDLIDRVVQDLEGAGETIVKWIDEAWSTLAGLILELIEQNDTLRRLFIVADYMFAMVRGVIADDLVGQGFDSVDDQNWSDWLLSHGAHPMTVCSPMALNTINLSYQYPSGDTTLPPQMAAGAYVHWTLRSFAYNGAMIYLFAAGCGETVIAPMYLVLKQRGVKFEFFHKVEALRLSADGGSIDAVEMSVQATLKNPDLAYDPLIDVKGLPSWPGEPNFDQLVEGDALRAARIDLESWWTPWVSPGVRTLRAGVDFDTIVFGISLGAVPFICADIIAARPDWAAMVAAIPTVQTQAMQLWLSEDITTLGWDIPLNPGDTIVSDTYLNPGDGQAEFSHLIAWEDWPADQIPKSLWYFCGLMSDHAPEAPFSDHDYPARQKQRVRFQSIQYLQAGMGPLLPLATTNARNPPGDPVGFDFNLLVVTPEAANPLPQRNLGVARIDSQFLRANIDPSERYVTSPPGSTKHRLKAWGSGFSNLVVAGDWIYTGINVGSVEGTVMGGKLASYAVSGAPALDTIIGYPLPKGV